MCVYMYILKLHVLETSHALFFTDKIYEAFLYQSQNHTTTQDIGCLGMHLDILCTSVHTLLY